MVKLTDDVNLKEIEVFYRGLSSIGVSYGIITRLSEMDIKCNLIKKAIVDCMEVCKNIIHDLEKDFRPKLNNYLLKLVGLRESLLNTNMLFIEKKTGCCINFKEIVENKLKTAIIHMHLMC